MFFNSLEFIVFLIINLCIYWFLIPNVYKKYFIIVSGTLFVSFHAINTVLLIFGLSMFVYTIGLAIRLLQHHHKKAEEMKEKLHTSNKQIFAMSLIMLIAVLTYFKYGKMLVGTWNDFVLLLGISEGVALPKIALPLGISFFVFEFIHYLVEVYKGAVKEHNFRDFLSFIFFFPSLVSGPIKRFNDFYDQQNSFTYQGKLILFNVGLQLIFLGFFKKVVIADTMNIWTERLTDPTAYSQIMLWQAALAYSVKIYFDFSGYTDIARGVGKLFGYQLPINFNFPYLRSNISEFWRNWHMSLSSWIRDYLFIPLGGSRCKTYRILLNLLVVMFICGLWHGAGWNFAMWGVYHGVGLAIFFMYRIFHQKYMPQNKTFRFFEYGVSTILTFSFVTIGWVMFAVPSMAQAIDAYKIMFQL